MIKRNSVRKEKEHRLPSTIHFAKLEDEYGKSTKTQDKVRDRWRGPGKLAASIVVCGVGCNMVDKNGITFVPSFSHLPKFYLF
jgi:hypothetical protein